MILTKIRLVSFKTRKIITHVNFSVLMQWWLKEKDKSYFVIFASANLSHDFS